MSPHLLQHQLTESGALTTECFPRADKLLVLQGTKLGSPVQGLCANAVVFDVNRAISAASHGGRGVQVTVPSWPCRARASATSGKHKPRATWGGRGSASPVLCAALVLSLVSVPPDAGYPDCGKVMPRKSCSCVRVMWLLVSEGFVPGSVEGNCTGSQSDELSVGMHIGEHTVSPRLAIGPRGPCCPLWLVPVSLALPTFLSLLCNVLSCSSISVAECWGLQAGDHWQMRHQGLTGFLRGLLKLLVPCRHSGQEHTCFSAL